MPDRRTVGIGVLVVAGVALVLWLMSQNRAERAGSGSDGDSPSEGPRMTVAALIRLVADDRETATRWFDGKRINVSGSVCLVAPIPHGEGSSVIVVGLGPNDLGSSTTVLGFVTDVKEAERLHLHEPAELQGTLDLSIAASKSTIALKEATVVPPRARGRSFR